MKKLLIFIYILCLAAPAVYSQDPYHLDKVVLTVNSYASKTPLFVKSLNDSVQIVSTEWDFPVLPVFKSVALSSGDRISWVELLNDGKRYDLDMEENILRLSEISPQKEETEAKPVKESINGFQLPGYTVRQSGNQLTVTFDQIIYGSSNYPGQTLEGKCEMIYVKP